VKPDTVIDRESKTQILRPTILSQAPRPKTGRTNQRRLTEATSHDMSRTIAASAEITIIKKEGLQKIAKMTRHIKVVRNIYQANAKSQGGRSRN